MTISEKYIYPLSVSIFTLGIVTALAAAAMVILSYTPIPFMDQWAVIAGLLEHGGHETLAHLWALHNEHRIVVGRLAVEADLYWFGGRSVSLLAEIFLVQLLHFGVFAWMLRRYASLSRTAWFTACGLLLFCFLTLTQAENLVWGIEITYVMAGFAATVAFTCAARCGEAVETGARFPVWILLLGVFAGLVSEGSLANGILVWPLFSLLAYRFRFPKWAQLLLGVVGVAAIAAYMKNYSSPTQHSNPLESVQHPLTLGRYLIVYIGAMWDGQPPSSPFPSVVEIIVVLSILISLGASLQFFVKRSAVQPLNGFLSVNVLFVLGAAMMTSLGRLRFGNSQAVSSRYQTIGLVFWACFGSYLLVWCSRALQPVRAVFQLQLVILLLMVGSGPRFLMASKYAFSRQAQIRAGFSALAQGSTPGSPEAEAIKNLYPDVGPVRNWYAYASLRKWLPDPREYGGSDRPAVIAVNPQTWPVSLPGYVQLPPEQCLGALDTAAPSQADPLVLEVRGWASFKTPSQRPTSIVLLFRDGKIVGKSAIHLVRQDVKTVFPSLDVNTGWQTSVTAPSGSAIRAFVVREESKLACPISNELLVP